LKDRPEMPKDPRYMEESLIVKVGEVQDLHKAFQSRAQWIILTASRHNLERLARQRLTPVQKERFSWSLPALIGEKEESYYRAAVGWYLKRGFVSWEVNNWGHLDYFAGDSRSNLISGHRFNIRNAAAMAALSEAGCGWSVLSLEITREELHLLSRGPLYSIPVVTLYAWPPLFISRLMPKLKEDKPIFTMRNEMLLFRKRGGHSRLYADRPVNWCEHLPFLRDLGFRCFLLDLSDGPYGTMNDFDRVLHGYNHCRPSGPSSLFNFDRRPL
jgi:putative protease